MSKTEDLAKLEKQLKSNCQVCFTKNVPVGFTRRAGRILHICGLCVCQRNIAKIFEEVKRKKEFAERWLGVWKNLRENNLKNTG